MRREGALRWGRRAGWPGGLGAKAVRVSSMGQRLRARAWAAALTAAADGVHRHPPVAMPQPLAVLDLALSAGPVAHELGVARADCGRTGLRHSEERDPIPDGRLRGHGANAALL